jgi:hypothetical protein
MSPGFCKINRKGAKRLLGSEAARAETGQDMGSTHPCFWRSRRKARSEEEEKGIGEDSRNF